MVINKEVFKWVDDQLEPTSIHVDGLIIFNVNEELEKYPSDILVGPYDIPMLEYLGLASKDDVVKNKNINTLIIEETLKSFYTYYRFIFIGNSTDQTLLDEILDPIYQSLNIQERLGPLDDYIINVLFSISYRIDQILANFILVNEPTSDMNNICWLEDIDFNIDLKRAYLLIPYVSKKLPNRNRYVG